VTLRLLAWALLALALTDSRAAEPTVHAFAITDAKGHRSLLIPSLHVAAPGIHQPSTRVLEGAARLVIEHPGIGVETEPESEHLSPWAATMTAQELDTYADRARCAGKTVDQAAAALRRPSVQLANMYAYTSCSTVGQPSRDGILAIGAMVQGVPMVALESDGWVEGQRRKVPSAVQEEAFRWILHHDVDEVLRPVVQAFNVGDFDTVARLTQASFGSPQGALAYYIPMVAERNAHWMAELPALIDAGAAVVVVGAMHVPGAQGLVQLLRARGYRVEPVELPADS